MIDYGAYDDLIHTRLEPQGLLSADDGLVEVPHQDLRAIRRAILDIDTFQSRSTSDDE